MESLDEIFRLFGEERRRFALYYLDEADGAVTIEELAERIDTWESDPGSRGPAGDEYDDMIIALEHDHLPKLDDATHVEYDRENEDLHISGLSSEADVILSVTKAIEQPSRAKDIVLGEDR